MRKTSIVPSKLGLVIWLELPYFVGVAYEGSVGINIPYNGLVPARVRLRNDVLRIETWNRWAYPLEPGASFAGLGEYWLDPTTADFRFSPQYCPEDQIDGWIDRLKRAGAPYVHVSQPPTMVEIETEIDGRLPVDAWDGLEELIPIGDLFNSSILPHLALVVDRYRIATIPRLRYGVHPISEVFVWEAVVELRAPDGAILQQIGYGFDGHSHLKGFQYLADRAGVHQRFDELVAADDLASETTISYIYTLLRMRRWGESLVLATAVVDDLLKSAVFKAAGNSAVAELIWKTYRNRHEDVFKEVLPAFGWGRLSVDDPVLWDSYRKARNARSTAAHGGHFDAFERGVEHETKNRINALANTARWLSIQMGRPWALDVYDENGEVLPSF